ncbi:acyl-CoA/acyl-ACP dehydrogenase [Streptomyces sp. So13.3]|uniref:acyl-CoA dehydrogenase family protein n=1 Tax=Streptomyces TaxID=1883 RepID=UPI00110599E1|nr:MULTISPECIES: acyl-CoA dehydrogenase family protein [Streptomyces]MCZ4094858.1 acyl-CoA/acyl-ACP dehydrogenase [Streptomyces sp. H39-C1]QNA74343.1 acyl-CoA/acyl-ACP dehydrogenase [Streptomyces sp. So13.3]
MDFSFTEEQLAAVEAARAVFSGVAPDSVPSPALTQGAVAEDFDRALWRKLADSDLLSLALAGTYGGAGLDPMALCLVLREAGKVLARVPLLETYAAGLAVQTYGSAALRARLLPAAGSGGVVLTVAANGRTGHDGAELSVQARQHQDDGTEEPGQWLLDGVQTAVPWAQQADHILVPAHTTEGRPVIAVVPRLHEGVTLAEQVSTSGERFAEITFDGVRIPADDVITADGSWEWLRNVLATGTCALALGLGEAVLGMTSSYAGKREQFGYPIATFQAVAVQAADRYIDLRAMEATLWQAAWRLSIDTPGALPFTGDVAVAKIWASEGVRRVVQTAQHLHGGFGADTDYALHRYHAWAKQLELSLGPAAAHEEVLGDLIAAHPLG